SSDLTSSCEYPYEDDHPHEEHQRVVADIAGLEEAQQVADEGDEVRAEREDAVDGEVDAAPEELRDLLQRPDDDRLVQLVDVPLVLQRARQPRRTLGERRVGRESALVEARVR